MSRFRSPFLMAAALALAALPAVVGAQQIGYEPGNEPPPDTWSQPTPPLVGPPLFVDIDLNAPGNAPALQVAHNGRYTALSGPLQQLDYRQGDDGVADITVLLVDNTYATGTVAPAGRAQVLVPLFAKGVQVGVLKLGAVATTGSPPPMTKAGVPCGQLAARAAIGGSLAFPIDPNLSCSPGIGQGFPGQRYCLVQKFGAKVGEVGPEACSLVAGT